MIFSRPGAAEELLDEQVPGLVVEGLERALGRLAAVLHDRADRGVLVGSGSPRDFLPSLDAPAVMRSADMLRWNAEHRTKYVVSNDRVAGVVVNGEARAYPLAVLNAHEVINDTLGGVGHTLCNSACLF